MWVKKKSFESTILVGECGRIEEEFDQTWNQLAHTAGKTGGDYSVTCGGVWSSYS